MQGIGLGLVFVPLSTVAFATLPSHLRTGGNRHHHADPQYRLVDRHIDGDRQSHQQDDGNARRLTEHVTPFNNALQMPDVTGNLNVHTDIGRALLDAIVTQQAAMIAYLNDFKLLMVLTLAVIPLVLVDRPRTAGARSQGRIRGDRLTISKIRVGLLPYARRAPGSARRHAPALRAAAPAPAC